MKDKIRIINTFAVCSVTACTLILASCASRSTVPPAINIQETYVEKMEPALTQTGFQYAYINSQAIQNYNKINLHLKLSDTMVEPGFFDKLKTGYLFYSQEDFYDEIIPYAKNSFYSAIAKSRTFTNSEGSVKALDVDIYITQVVINDAFFGSLGNIPSPSWLISKPIGMGLAYIGDKSGGAVAIEVILKDAETGEIVGTLADREKGVFALFNIEGFSMSASQKRLLDTWSYDLVTVLDGIKSGSIDNGNQPIVVAPLLEWVFLGE